VSATCSSSLLPGSSLDTEYCIASSSSTLVAHALYAIVHSLHLFFLVALLQYAIELCWLLVLPLFFLIPLLQYAVTLCRLLVLPLFLMVPLLQYAVALCRLLVLPHFFLVALLQYAVELCPLLVLPLFLLDPDVFSFYYQHPLCVAML